MAFNLGAVQSQQALQTDRKAEPGLKECARLFQVGGGLWAAGCWRWRGRGGVRGAGGRVRGAPPNACPRPRAAARPQESAGTFAHLRDVASLRVEQPRPLDLTPEAASMLEKLMLGQAQVGGAQGVDGGVLGQGTRSLHCAAPRCRRSLAPCALICSPWAGVLPGGGHPVQEEPRHHRARGQAGAGVWGRAAQEGELPRSRPA